MSRPRKAPSSETPELEREIAFLSGYGLVERGPAGDLSMTPDGRDWMLWAIWQALGRPGMPAETEAEEASS